MSHAVKMVTENLLVLKNVSIPEVAVETSPLSVPKTEFSVIQRIVQNFITALMEFSLKANSVPQAKGQKLYFLMKLLKPKLTDKLMIRFQFVQVSHSRKKLIKK